jgi:hypothetical protein
MVRRMYCGVGYIKVRGGLECLGVWEFKVACFFGGIRVCLRWPFPGVYFERCFPEVRF